MNLGLVSPVEVLSALFYQNEQRSRGVEPERIGQILFERGQIERDDVVRVMEEVEARTRTLDIPGYDLLQLASRDQATLRFTGRVLGTNRMVTAKILRFRLAEHPGDAQRYLEEIRRFSLLDHPNILSLQEVGQLEGIPYLVQENIPGVDLSSVVQESGPVEEGRARSLFAAVASGLRHAHSKDILHGALRPEWILLPRTGGVKLDGFAFCEWCAHAALSGPARPQHPHFLSPEQIRSEPLASRKSDMYSLGANLFFALTGHPPFRGDHHEVIRQQLRRSPPDPRILVPGLSDSVTTLLGRLLEKDPDRRPAEMAEVIHLLEGGEGEPSPIDPFSGEGNQPDRLRSRRR